MNSPKPILKDKYLLNIPCERCYDLLKYLKQLKKSRKDGIVLQT
jgi:hypothetical protein